MLKLFSSAVLCSFILSVVALAQTGPTLLLKPLLSESEVLESNGTAGFLAGGSTHNVPGGDNSPFQMSFYDYSGRLREQRENFVPRFGWNLTYLDIDTTNPTIPDNLTDVSVAAGLELGKFSDWRMALTAGVGYAGNTPFGESDAWYGMGTLVVFRKLDEKTDLAFVVDYNGNRTVWPDIPLPGIAYRHEFDPTLSYTVGIPVSSIRWQPTHELTFEATWTFVESFDARLDYKLAPAWKLFGTFERRQNAFHVTTVPGNNRLLFQQRRVETGIQWQPWDHTSLLLAGGYAFSTEFSQGWDQSNSTLVADISDEPYVRISFERRF